MTLTAITRQQNPNGTFRYRIAALPDFAIDASKVLYTHASVFGDPSDPIVQFHKSATAAMRATYKYAAKLGVVTISDAA